MDKAEVLVFLQRKGSRRNVAGLARYGIKAARAFGVPMGKLLVLAKRIGKDHALALDLWESGWYEARLLAALVDDPEQVTRRQMNAWAAASKTGVIVTRSASSSSTRRRSPGRKRENGPSHPGSSSSGAALS